MQETTFRSLAAFAQFASDLDRSTRNQLERGLRIQEILKQPQFNPMPLEKQVMILWAVTNNHLDDVPVDKVQRWEAEFHRTMEMQVPELGQTIARDKEVSPETAEALGKAIEMFKQQVSL